MTKPTSWTRRLVDTVVTAGLMTALAVNAQVMALPTHFV